MEWDKNTKIIVAVVVVIILIAAGVGIALAANNNNNGGSGDKEAYAKTGGISLSTDTAYIPVYMLNDKGEKVNIVSANGMNLPAKKTTIGSDVTGWTWDETNKCYKNSTATFKMTVSTGTLTNKGTDGKLEYELSYDKGAKIDYSVTYKGKISTLSLHIKWSTRGMEESAIPDLYIKNVKGDAVNIKSAVKEVPGEMYKEAYIDLPTSGTAEIYSTATGWTLNDGIWSKDSGRYQMTISEPESVTVTPKTTTDDHISCVLTYDLADLVGEITISFSGSQ